MNQFIELTGRNDKKVLINLNAVVALYSVTIKEKDKEERAPYTAIKTNAEVIENMGNSFYVKETVEEIKTLFNKI